SRTNDDEIKYTQDEGCVCTIVCGHGPRPEGQSFRGGFRGFRGGPQAFRRPAPQHASNTDGGKDDTNGESEYHYSWRHDNNRKYTHGQAVSYCTRLSGSWVPISIETEAEDSFVNRVVSGDRLDYIWTGGEKSGSGFKWPTGSQISYNNWSHTGGARRPQPDNRERGGEKCLAILNNFYRDGLKWHDVACHHRKPIICERKAKAT
ncbi:unnamed protein product, partial [Meganyctiphanes norvegica]